MNESFFGQYSVFCVFGSVVGCVVVPLIAQVLQQQSMECMILSAIVISLTAAHLNKKGGSDASKILLGKEFDKKKLHPSINKKQKSHTNYSHSNNNTTHSHAHHEHEYMQQQQNYEHLKVVEMERRNEEKRLKKIRKREERLKKREEEHKKQKELEERYRTLKEKRQKQKENIYKTTSNTTYTSSVENFEKYCQSDSYCRKQQRHGLSAVDENKPRKQQHYSCTQRIPRFERSRTASVDSNQSSKSYTGNNRSVTGSLSIRCSSLSTSCSSLSSIGSSGSSSPPLPVSPPPCSSQTSAWSVPVHNQQPSPNESTKTPWSTTGCVQCPNIEQPLKSILAGSSQHRKTSMKIDSSSLFCTQQDHCVKAPSSEVSSFSGEYSLFGPPKFTNMLAKSTVM